MAESRSLETIIADWRAEADVLDRNGAPVPASILRRCATETEQAAEDFLVFLSLGDAKLRSGHSASWFNRRYAEWADAGHAMTRNGVRYFRQLVVPTRPDVAGAKARGRRGERAA